MFTKILFPTDFSEHSEKVKGELLKLKKCNIKEIVLMHVLDVRVFSYSTMLNVIEIENFDHEGELVKELRNQIEKWKDEFTALGFNVTTIVSEGIPFQEILKTAEDEKVSMIAIGEKGGGAVERMLLGSTAEKVVRNAKIPVLLIR